MYAFLNVTNKRVTNVNLARRQPVERILNESIDGWGEAIQFVSQKNKCYKWIVTEITQNRGVGPSTVVTKYSSL